MDIINVLFDFMFTIVRNTALSWGTTSACQTNVRESVFFDCWKMSLTGQRRLTPSGSSTHCPTSHPSHNWWAEKGNWRAESKGLEHMMGRAWPPRVKALLTIGKQKQKSGDQSLQKRSHSAHSSGYRSWALHQSPGKMDTHWQHMQTLSRGQGELHPSLHWLPGNGDGAHDPWSRQQ